jgi:hypothetical protein
MVNSRLMSNLEFVSRRKIVARIFAAAATKSNVSTSSLSNVRIGGAPPVASASSFLRRLLRRLKL